MPTEGIGVSLAYSGIPSEGWGVIGIIDIIDSIGIVYANRRDLGAIGI